MANERNLNAAMIFCMAFGLVVEAVVSFLPIC